ncbi:MAG: hypothetical protein AAGE52_31645 [Myxococcota bacterium]
MFRGWIIAIVLGVLGSLPNWAEAQCTQSLARTPLRFSADASEVLIEVVERDSCYPDGVGGHRMEIRRTSDLARLERIELQRGARDWSDPTTWEARNPEQIEADITRRRSTFLEEHQARFPIRAIHHATEWEDRRLVFAGEHWNVPRGVLALAGPYDATLPTVDVWMPANRALRVAVGTVDRAGRDRLLILRS